MTNDQTATLVLKDSAGSYYLVSQETLEGSRVPAEHTAELERRLTAAAQGETDGMDAQGYFAPLAFLGAAAYGAAWTVLGYTIAKYVDEQLND